MFRAPDPYRSVPRYRARAQADFGPACAAERILSEAFVIAWSVLRAAVCAAKGVDADGILSVLVVLVVGVELAATFRRARRGAVGAAAHAVLKTRGMTEICP